MLNLLPKNLLNLTMMRVHGPKDYEVNARAQYALTQALNEDDRSRVIDCKSAYEVWNVLIITHEGTSQVKRSKIDLLNSQYENFYMLENETIDEMLTRFTKITNTLSSLGDKIDNDQKIRKVIELFPNLGKSRQPPSRS